MRSTAIQKGGTMSERAGPRRSLLTTALALASALAMSVAIAPQAQAQTTNPEAPPAASPVDPSTPEELGADAKPDRANLAGRCPQNRICLFEHTYYRGRMVIYAIGSSNMTRPPYFNDMTSSIQNNTPYRWCVYEHANYGGRAAYVQPRSWYPVLYPWWNDRISSIRRC